MPVILY